MIFSLSFADNEKISNFFHYRHRFTDKDLFASLFLTANPHSFPPSTAVASSDVPPLVVPSPQRVVPVRRWGGTQVRSSPAFPKNLLHQNEGAKK